MTHKGEIYARGFVRKPESEILNEQNEDNIKVDLNEMEWKDGLGFCGLGYGRIVGLVIRVP